MIPKEELFDDSLTNLQWLQNLNVSIVNPVPPIPSVSVDSASRSSGACRRIRGKDIIGPSRLSKSRSGSVAQTSNTDLPVKRDPSNQSTERQNAKLQSKLLNGKPKNLKKSPLPPLIHTSKTPLPSQYRSRVGGPNRDSQKDSLPRLSGSNDSLKLNTKLCENAIILNASPELALLSDTTNNQYVLSPRQMDRDLLPGQVDYKNNPYVKPALSHLALIFMALRRSRSDKMTIQKICEWIKTNFMYYRFVRPDWQNSIRDNLARHKCFERVGRSAGKAAFWRIHPKYEEKLSEDVLRKRRLASAGEEKGQQSSASDKSSSRGCSPSIEQVSDYDFLRPEDFAEDEDDFLDNEKFTGGSKTSSASSSNKGSAGHKRKQATPNKRSSHKKSRQQQTHLHPHAPQRFHNNNPLADQTPEVGSLKGEFTFTTILEDMRLDGSLGGSSVNSSLSLPATPVLANNRRQTTHPVTGSSIVVPAVSTTASASESMLTDVMLPIDPSLMINSSGGGVIVPELCNARLPSPLDRETRDILDEFLNTEKLTRSSLESLGRRRNGATLNTPTLELEANEEELSKNVEALDLTVTGSKIERPEGWNPEDSLDFLLGEQVDNFTLDENDLDVGALSFFENCDTNDENSPRGRKKKGRRRPGSSSSGTGSITSPRRQTPSSYLALTPQLQNQLRNSRSSTSSLWQESAAATDTIQSLLGDDFDF